MTVFENLKSMNIDEFAEWFEKNCVHDNDPCIRWFDRTYCKNCEAVFENELEYAYCELNHKCRYFQYMDEMLDNLQTIKLWLKSELTNQAECPDCRYFAGCEAACGGKACDMFVTNKSKDA